MAGTKWSEDTTIKFVTEYVSHECLWNTKHPAYKIKCSRMAAYRDIKNSMNISNFGEKEIVVKIKNIRSTYSQELKKIKDSRNSGAGPDNVYVPSLKWFSILHTIRKSQSNLDDSKTETVDDSVGDNSFQDDNCIGVTTSQYNVKVSLDPLAPTVNAKPKTLKKRRLEELSLLLSKVKDVSVINNSPPPEEHEFEIFGRSVAAQLKMLPLEKALQAQHYIQSYITRLRLQECPPSPSSLSTLPPTSQESVHNIVKCEQMSP